jgi:hypothetical protein
MDVRDAVATRYSWRVFMPTAVPTRPSVPWSSSRRGRLARGDAATHAYVPKFLGMRDGHRLARSFVAIKSSKVRDIVVEIAALLAGTTADRP